MSHWPRYAPVRLWWPERLAGRLAASTTSGPPADAAAGIGSGPDTDPGAHVATKPQFGRWGIAWPIAAAVAGAGNTTALVGTPEQVAESLLDYHDLGVTTLLIRGFDPLNDALEYGRELIPLVRAEVARRDRDRPAA